MTLRRRIGRRDFLRRSGLLGLAALGAPAVGRARGANGAVAVGVIGCGARGTELIKALSEGDGRSAQVVAVCDVYRPRLEAAAAQTKGEAFGDYRAMLRRPGIDAVIVATPDHWHAPMALEALGAGKDVYLETPMALRWQDARRVAQAAQRSGRLLQVGATSCAEDRWWQARDAIVQNAIGKLVWSQTCFSANSRVSPWNRPFDADFRPRRLDWRAFVGPAPSRGLEAERFFRWQKFRDYSGGLATSVLFERLSRLLVAVGPALPVRVCAAGSGRVFPDQELPDNFHAIVHYPNDHTVVLISTHAAEQGVGDIIRGHEGSVVFGASDARIVAQRIHQDKHPEQVHLRPRSRPDLLANFIECIRGGGHLDCGPEVACPAAVAVALAIQAFRTGEMLHFDPKTQRTVS